MHRYTVISRVLNFIKSKLFTDHLSGLSLCYCHEVHMYQNQGLYRGQLTSSAVSQFNNDTFRMYPNKTNLREL